MPILKSQIDAERGGGGAPPPRRTPTPSRANTPPAKRSTFDFGASRNAPAYTAIKGGNAIGFVGAVADALRRTGEPASAVAYLAQGKPKEALGSLADIVRQKEQVRTIGLSDIPIVHRATGKLPWYVRTPLRFGLDVAGDPLTYVTFGTAGVARGASGKAVARFGSQEAKALAAARAAKSGAGRGTPEALPLLSETAAASIKTGIEKQGLDSAVQIGLRLPFTREKSITLAGVNTEKVKRKLGSAASSVPGASRVGDAIKTSVAPSRGADFTERYTAQNVRRAAEVEARAWQKEGQDLARRIYQRARENKIKPADLHRLIVRHLDDPANHDAPAFAQDLVDETRGVFERIGARELTDGVQRSSLENYVPHILIGDESVKKVKSKWASSLMAAENPYYVKERAAKTFHELDMVGAKYETNIERLIEARAAASVRSRMKYAIDGAVYKEFGVGAPLSEIPAAIPVSRLASTSEWRAMRDGWREVADAPRYKDARLPTERAISLERVHRAIDDSMSNPNAPLRFMRKVSGTWKRLALATPGFHMRNQLSDGLQQWWGGARNPISYVQSGAIMMGKDTRIKTKSGTYSADEMFEIARDHGIIDAGFVAQEAASAEARNRARVEGARYGRARYINWLRTTEKIGAAREDFNRLGFFIERLKAGDNPTEAAMKVREYLFDYGEVGEFVQVARRYWAPFITYASKAIPLTGKQIARRPGTMSNYYHLQQTLLEEAGNPDVSGLAPEDRLSLPLPPAVAALLQRASGAQNARGEGPPLMLLNPKGVMGFTIPTDITGALLEGGDFWKGAQRLTGQYGSPLITKWPEMLTNHSLYYGRGFRDGEKIRANAIEAELLARVLGGRGFGTKRDKYAKRDVPAINPRLAILSRFVPTAGQTSSLLQGAPGVSGGSDSPRIGWLRTLGGVPVMPYDRARDEWFARQYGDK